MSGNGPGETCYVATEDGGIACRLWNDPAWQTMFADAHDLRSADSIARLLRKAYLAGWSDRGVAIRRAIGVPGRLG